MCKLNNYKTNSPLTVLSKIVADNILDFFSLFFRENISYFIWSRQFRWNSMSYFLWKIQEIIKKKKKKKKSKCCLLLHSTWRVNHVTIYTMTTQLAFYVNLHRAVIGPSATLMGRWRPDIDLRRMLAEYQAGTWRSYNVALMSMQRHDIALILMWHCINTLCLLGINIPYDLNI